MDIRIASSLSVLLLCGAVAVSAAPRGLRGAATPFQNDVSIKVEGDVRVIRSNGIPDHETGQFPGPGNPNTISPQKYEFHVPLHPKIADKITVMRMQPFGVAVNGVVFDPGAAEWWHGDRNWQYEPLTMAPHFLGTDASHAHVQPTGAYHYHGIPTALVHALTGGEQKMVIVGWAADGFPIYNDVGHTDPKDAASPLKTLKSSYRVKSGQRPSGPGGNYDGKFVADYEYVPKLGDLDECNGLFGVTPEYPDGMYHYVLTEQFPYIPRMYRGTPDPSFMRHPGGPGGAGQRRPDGAFHLIPPFALEQLNLTEEQRRQIQPLDEEARQRLEKILTPEQLRILKESRPRRGGPGAPEGPAVPGGQGAP